MDNKYNNPIQNRTNQQVILLADRDSIGNRKNHAVMGYGTMFKKQYEPIISVNLTATKIDGFVLKLNYRKQFNSPTFFISRKERNNAY